MKSNIVPGWKAAVVIAFLILSFWAALSDDVPGWVTVAGWVGLIAIVAGWVVMFNRDKPVQ